MWMMDPRGMCRKHLLGEHVECHMIAGSLIKRKQLDGFVDKNCLEIKSLGSRHRALSQEMVRRGYNHASPMPEWIRFEASEKVLSSRVDRPAALKELHGRCPECKRLAGKISKKDCTTTLK